MFERGAFSANPREPLRVDANVLANLTVTDLWRGFQVSDHNALVGLEGRVDLLRRLGALVASKPDVFGRLDAPRPGGLFDRLAMLAEKMQLPAPAILSELLQQLGPIWPSRLTLGGVALSIGFGKFSGQRFGLLLLFVGTGHFLFEGGFGGNEDRKHAQLQQGACDRMTALSAILTSS